MIAVRRLTSLPELMEWRAEVMEHVFGVVPDATLLESNLNYYERHIADGSHLAFVASADGVDCGCGGVCFTDELPSPDNRGGKCAYLMNIYVRRGFRNVGIAGLIVSRLIEESVKRGCEKIYLETTDSGRPVYESLGFADMPDMMKYKCREGR